MSLRDKDTQEQQLEEHKKRREMYRLLMEQEDLIVRRMEDERDRIQNDTKAKG